MRRAPHSLAPLRHRGFRLLAAGQFASNIGDAFYAVALPWYVLANHGGVLMLASFGVFPISVALGALVVHHLGPAPFFPLAGAAVAAAILVGVSQRSWRNFGATDRSTTAADVHHLTRYSRPGAASATADTMGHAS